MQPIKTLSLLAGLLVLAQGAAIPKPYPEIVKRIRPEGHDHPIGPMSYDDLPAECGGTMYPGWCDAIKWCIRSPGLKVCHAAEEILWEYRFDGRPFYWWP